MDCRFICGTCHEPVQSVYFSDKMPFSDAADCGVA